MIMAYVRDFSDEGEGIARLEWVEPASGEQVSGEPATGKPAFGGDSGRVNFARLDGRIAFVEGAVPGDKLQVYSVQKRGKRLFVRADDYRLISRSEKRRHPRCPIFGVCGGCSLQHVHYEDTLLWKEKRVRDVLGRIAKIENVQELVRPCLGMDSPERFRGRVRLKVSAPDAAANNSVGGLDSTKIGFYKRGSNEVVETADCLIQTVRMNRARVALKQMVEALPRLERARLKEITLRENRRGDSFLVIFHCSGQVELEAWKKAFAAVRPELESVLGVPFGEKVAKIGAGPAWLGVFIHLENGADRREEEAQSYGQGLNERLISRRLDTDSILDESDASGPVVPLTEGVPFVERYGDVEIEYSPLAFSQTNLVMDEVLFDVAVDFVKRAAREIVLSRKGAGNQKNSDATDNLSILELYCGSGSLTLKIAEALSGSISEGCSGEASRLVSGEFTNAPKVKIQAVELFEGAVEDAKKNAAQNSFEKDYSNEKQISGEIQNSCEKYYSSEKDNSCEKQISGEIQNSCEKYYSCEKHISDGKYYSRERKISEEKHYSCERLRSTGKQNFGGIKIIPEFICADAADALNFKGSGSMGHGDLARRQEKRLVLDGAPDILVLDPPRSGLEPAVRKGILELGPQYIVYVSCDPATMARDIGELKSHYNVLEVVPVDMFPWSGHVECVVLMARVQELD